LLPTNLDGQAEVLYTACGFSVKLYANGGVFDYLDAPNKEQLGVRDANGKEKNQWIIFSCLNEIIVV
jgi:hypothetical protein